MQNTNSVTVTNAVEVTFETIAPPVLPNIPNQVIAAGDTLVITNTAADTNAGALFYKFTNSLALTAPTITTNGIITWATTTNDPAVILPLAQEMLTWRSTHLGGDYTGFLLGAERQGRWPRDLFSS